jgi:hypothetical protein
MRTDLQIEASRQNSQLSTGPRTEAGKSISSMNSLKTGIYAQAEIIPGENPADLAALATDYFDRFHPDAPEQRVFVDILVQSEWTLRRLRRAEAQLWARLIKETESSFHENTNPLGRAANYQGGKPFDRLQRRIDCTLRNLQRALKDLKSLQSDRGPSVPEPQPSDPADTAPNPPDDAPALPAPLGFVPSTPSAAPEPAAPLGFVPSIAPRKPPTSVGPRQFDLATPPAWRL